MVYLSTIEHTTKEPTLFTATKESDTNYQRFYLKRVKGRHYPCLRFISRFRRSNCAKRRSALSGTVNPRSTEAFSGFSSPETNIAVSLSGDPASMSSGELLDIQPQELQFPFELRKQIPCSLQLSNKTDNYVAFKVKTTNPKKYCVRPNTGVVLPRSTCDVTVTMQAQKEAPADLQCKDKFLLQSVVASPGTTTKDINPEMFNREAGHNVEECKLRVVYVAPPRPPSPVREGSDEDSSPRVSVSENGHSNVEFMAASRDFNERVESQGTTSETTALISKVTEERNSAMDQQRRLQQEVDLLRREVSRSGGGIPFMYVILVAAIGFILGYLLKRT